MTAAIANDRLRKRFAQWDSDGTGTLERTDFEKEAVQIAQAFGKSPKDAEAKALRDALTGLFEHLAREAGISTTGSLSEDEFVRITEKLIFEDGESAFNDALGPVVRGIVGLCDKNADGQINATEFASWLTAVGVDRSQAAEAFVTLDTDASGELSVDELLAAVREFHFGRLDVELLG